MNKRVESVPMRDRSLIMGRGVYRIVEGQVKCYPYKKRGDGSENVLAMLKVRGGHKTF